MHPLVNVYRVGVIDVRNEGDVECQCHHGKEHQVRKSGNLTNTVQIHKISMLSTGAGEL